ncbi:unnamed protein product [Cylicocyclus nassatus]|uniref:Folliculin n=1 Tax=Cylicocyclus nassatus TaxID=53992 RepID=A0AA36H8H8_CYLNA|nr:unnamed protein product [Cylicocyclus nassatus]
MQAVIALCHFCENHGPRVMMITQPMRSVQLPSSSISVTNTACQVPDHHDNDRPIYYGDCTPEILVDPEERCNACTSFGNINQPCLLSNDHENRTSYISTQIPLKERVYERVRNACLRSLSCEISAPHKGTSSPLKLAGTPALRVNSLRRDGTMDPLEDSGDTDVDGPVFFGDSDNGYCFSLTFRLRDSKARGFLRLYSFIVVSNDMTYIINNYEFFLQALTAVKEKLQSMAAAIFESEMDQEDAMRPQYASMAGRLPTGWFRPSDRNGRRVAIDTKRNLQTITGDDTIWNRLHRQMMWTLRTEILRYCDHVLEGVPTQDMLVMMEMEPADILELDLAQPNQHEVTLQQLANLKLAAKLLYEGNEADLDLVIKQIITGEQLVVESPDRLLAKQLILALSNLLPIGCLKVLTYSDTYESKYNLLGGALDIDIPLDANVLVLRIRADDPSFALNGSLESCSIEVRRRPAPNTRHPKLLDRYRQLLLDNEVYDTVLEATLRSTREHWVSKAKLIYQISRQKEITPTLNISNVFQIVRGCSEQDRDVLTFWQKGLSKVYKESVIATIHQLPH